MEAVAHGELERGGCGPERGGLAQEKDPAGEGAGGKEVETAVETGKGEGSLEFEGGKCQLEVEAGDGREGDPEGGGQGLVEFDLQLRAVGGGVEDHKMGEGMNGDNGVPKPV